MAVSAGHVAVINQRCPVVSSEYKNMVQARHSATSDACAMGGNMHIKYEVWLLLCKKQGKVAGLSLLLC